MAFDIRCPACDEDEDLEGRRDGDVIEITCGACGRAWTRDPAPTCPRCGSGDVEAALRAIVEKSRGTQLSIVSTEVVHLCRSCDADALARYRISKSPLMPDELPTVNPQDG